MIDKNMIEIFFANKDDISDILKIQEIKLLKRKTNESDFSLQSTGFLVNELLEKDLRNALDDESQILIVARHDQKVVGYMFGYDFHKLLSDNPKWLNQTDLNKELFDFKKVIYGKHIASDGNVPGVGKMLFQKFFEIAKSRGYTLYVGEILESPIKNERSISKHSQLERIGKYVDDNSFIWGIYSKII